MPNSGTVLELGDRIRVVTPRDRMDEVSKYLGDSMKAISETDFLSLSLGVVLGVLVILIPTSLIGVCASAEMDCNAVLKPTMIVSGILLILLSLAALVLNERKADSAA